MSRFGLLLLTLTSALLNACAVNPVTGEKELSLVSASQEVAIGTENYGPSQQAQGGRYAVDPELNLYVNRVGQALARVSDRPDLPYEFVVLNNDVPNARALPGGKIALNRGLLVLLEDEAQLAAVLSHEIVHAAARHSANQMSRAILLGLGVQAAGIASRDSDYGDLLILGASAGAGAWSAKYGREQELQADAYGIDYMVRAGYDPRAAVELQQKFVELARQRGNSSWLEGLFASHPPSQERVDKNRARATPLARGKRNREAFQRALAQVKKDQPAYALQQQALQAASAKNYSQALGLLNQAITKQPAEALFYTSKGQVLLADGKTTAAAGAFARAAALNPEYYLGHLGLGLINKKQGRPREAKRNLLASSALLPTQLAQFHLGEIELAEGNTDKASAYFRAVAEQGGELGEQAQQRLQALQTPAK